jgi:hypothetical protein
MLMHELYMNKKEKYAFNMSIVPSGIVCNTVYSKASSYIYIQYIYVVHTYAESKEFGL